MFNTHSTLLIGPLSENPDGLSMAFDVVVRNFAKRGLQFKVVNTKSNDITRQVGAFSFRRAIEIIKALVEYWCLILFAQRIYLLIGLSRVSFLRDLLFIWTAYFFRRRVVLHVHTGGYRVFFDAQSNWVKRIIVATLMRANAIIILGESLRKQFDFLPGAKEKLFVVPNCALVENKQENLKKKEILGSEPIRLLYLSNLIESKGYLDCLEAVRILHYERNIPVDFSLCGGAVPHKFSFGQKTEQEILDHFFEQVESKELRKIVKYYGVVTGTEKEWFFINSHLLVLPTYYAWEGQPISIIEALAFGMPVIATPYRGIPEQVINNYNGFLVDAQSPIEIANKIEKLWKEPNLYKEMSINATEHFERYFTQQKHLDKLLPIIFGN